MSEVYLDTTHGLGSDHQPLSTTTKSTAPDVSSSHSRQDSGQPSREEVAASELDFIHLAPPSTNLPPLQILRSAPDLSGASPVSSQAISESSPTPSPSTARDAPTLQSDNNHASASVLSLHSSPPQVRAAREALLLPQIAALELQIQAKRQHLRQLKTQRRAHPTADPDADGESVVTLQLTAQILRCEQSVRANAQQLKELRKQVRMLALWSKEERRRGREDGLWEKLRSGMQAMWEVSWM